MKKSSKPNSASTLHVALRPGKTEARTMADLAAGGVALNAMTLKRFAGQGFGELELTELLAALTDSGKAINDNDLSQAEQVLNAQAVTLNMMFAELARRASLNMGEHLAATETYMRLALRAQAQSRATFETLAAMKNPPTVFARQMNVANGPQQVNNHASPAATSRAPACSTDLEQNELSDGGGHAGTLLDTGAATGAVRAHQGRAALGTLHRPAHSGRKSGGGA